MEKTKKTNLFLHYKYMLSLVGSVVNEANVQPPPQGICWDILYKVARENCFSAMLYPVLKDNPKLPQPVLNDFLRDYQLYVAKDLTQQFELQKMLDFCEREAIANLPLKGCVLKRLYPQPYMRFMGDIDLWTDASGVKKLRDFLVQCGYTLVSRTGIHDEYEKPPHMAVEVHKKLVIDENRAASFFNVEIPQRLIRTDGRKYSYAMMPQDFYLHLLDHTAKHFYGTGITPRMILDFYMLEKKQAVPHDGQLEVLLKRLHFQTFAQRLTMLAHDWFSPDGAGLAKDPFSLYVIQNGSFGRRRNAYVAKTARETKEEKPPSKAGYVLRRLFPSYTMLKGKFPVLEKAPALTPFMYFPWWATWFDTLFIHRRLDYRSLKYINDISGESTKQMRALYKEMELDYRR